MGGQGGGGVGLKAQTDQTTDKGTGGLGTYRAVMKYEAMNILAEHRVSIDNFQFPIRGTHRAYIPV